MKKDTIRALVALMPLFATIVSGYLVPLVAHGSFINVLVQFGYITLNSQPPLAVLIIIFGPIAGPLMYYAGWTWGQIQAVYGFFGAGGGLIAAVLLMLGIPGGAPVAIAAAGCVTLAE
ncbi:MAG: hypothetical protein HXY34_01605 [Candidatus Thorarchaeota archaeon]|nr:hypothetical protein [Candidatus Thorarchaeota archaeon]